MTERSLRDFCNEVKRLIDMESYAQAIETSRHILRIYPRHIETYSLLGQACLENGDIREAVELFQRALSANPEDVTAWTGLAAAYEQDDLPEVTAWNLERAFELDPTQNGVRQELQRLYGQIHHVKELRLKLNSAALGRTYLRGGLYQQAVNEFRSVLAKEPNLRHIKVGLAIAHWQLGQRVEAAEVCLDILDELPNCIQANLILGEIWLRSDRETEGEQLLQLAEELDPENRMAQELFGQQSPLPPRQPMLPPLGELPAVMPRRIEQPRRPALAELQATDAQSSPVEWPEPLTATADAMELGAMDAGFDLAAIDTSEIDLESPLPLDVVESDIPDEELPEWLQEFRLAEGSPVETESRAQEVFEAGGEPPAEEEYAEALADDEQDIRALAAELPDDLRALIEETMDAELPVGKVIASTTDELALPAEDAAAEELPDWLREIGETAEPAGRPPFEGALDEAEPDAEAEEAVEHAGAGEDLYTLAAELPDDLRALVEEVIEFEPKPAGEPEAAAEDIHALAAELPDDLRALVEETLATESAASVEQAEPVVDIPLAAVDSEPAPVETIDEPPDWLTGMAAETPAAGPGEEEVPDWLQTLAQRPESEVAITQPDAGREAERTRAAGDDIPTWLKELTQETPSAAAARRLEQIAESVEIESDTDEEAIPGWLDELRTSAIEKVPVLGDEREVAPEGEKVKRVDTDVEILARRVEPPVEVDSELIQPEAILPTQSLEEVELLVDEELVKEPVQPEEPTPDLPEPETLQSEASDADTTLEPELLESDADSFRAAEELAVQEPEAVESIAAIDSDAEPATEEPEHMDEILDYTMSTSMLEEMLIDSFAGDEAADMETAIVEPVGAIPVEEEIEAGLDEDMYEITEMPGKDAPTPFITQALERLDVRADDHEMRLALARAWRDEDRIELADEHYRTLIEADQYLDSVVADMEDLARESGAGHRAWLLLGDGYMKQGRLSDAMDAYRRALGK